MKALVGGMYISIHCGRPSKSIGVKGPQLNVLGKSKWGFLYHHSNKIPKILWH